ncbi:hypothetical protein ABPG75_004464 [Micractinium tetrahymenae]
MESDDDELFVAALDSFEAAPGRPAGCDNAQAHGGSVTVQQPRPHPQPLRTANGAGGGVGGGGDGGGVRSLFIGKRGCGAAAQQAAQQPAPSKAAQQPAPSKAAQHPAPSKPRRLKQLFDYLLVLDIEATCDRDKAAQLLPQEIIELSCVIVDTAACSVRPGSWQCYVKPDQHPVLTEFCTELTGITQAQVDAGVPLKTALEQLDAWLREQGLIGQGKTFSPLTWRDWDLKVMMASECKWRKIEQPKYLRRWIDLSAVWFKHSTKRGNLRASVEAAGLAWQGRAHSAIDDAFNTARLAVKLMQGGLILGITGSFGNLDASGRFKQGTLLGLATAGAKGAAGSGVGGGAASGSGASGQAQGAGQLAGGPKKKRVFDDSGAWNGCCYCGARAKKRTVKRPGPNNGRDFWSCGRFTMTGGAGCDFFKFVDDVSAPPAVASGGGGRQRRR